MSKVPAASARNPSGSGFAIGRIKEAAPPGAGGGMA